MSGIDPILAPALQDRMSGDEVSAVEDTDPVWQLMHLDDASGAIRHTVVIAADRDETFMADASFELQQRIEGRVWQALQIELLGCEGLRHDPLRRGVQPHIGDCVEPVLELAVQILQIAE